MLALEDISRGAPIARVTCRGCQQDGAINAEGPRRWTCPVCSKVQERFTELVKPCPQCRGRGVTGTSLDNPRGRRCIKCAGKGYLRKA